jgi:HSP20 family protein
MPPVKIRRIETNKSLAEHIRERAFEIFQQRGGVEDSALEDWLKAEQEFRAPAESELIEKKAAFEFQMPVPGFTAKEVQVFVAPEEVTVRAEHSHKEDRKQGVVAASEFTEEKLFRFFSLPAPINIDKVTANLDKGVLKLSAAKAA